MRSKDHLKMSLISVIALACLPTAAHANSHGDKGISANGNYTYVAPYYAQPNSSAPTDAIAAFSTIFNRRTPTTILRLAVPRNSQTLAAYGAVANNGGPPKAFSSLAFDVSDVNPLAAVELFVSQDNGQTDGGYAYFQDIVAPPTATTPPGYTHCVVTRNNLKGYFAEGVPIAENNTFLYSALIQFGDTIANRSTNIANINFNQSPTNAVAVTRPAQNNAFIYLLNK